MEQLGALRALGTALVRHAGAQNTSALITELGKARQFSKEAACMGDYVSTVTSRLNLVKSKGASVFSFMPCN